MLYRHGKVLGDDIGRKERVAMLIQHVAAEIRQWYAPLRIQAGALSAAGAPIGGLLASD
jgi:hypothetical protein